MKRKNTIFSRPDSRSERERAVDRLVSALILATSPEFRNGDSATKDNARAQLKDGLEAYGYLTGRTSTTNPQAA